MDPILFICQIQFDWLPLCVAGAPVIGIITSTTAILSTLITFCNTEAERMTFSCFMGMSKCECQKMQVFAYCVFFLTHGVVTLEKTTSFPL